MLMLSNLLKNGNNSIIFSNIYIHCLSIEQLIGIKIGWFNNPMISCQKSVFFSLYIFNRNNFLTTFNLFLIFTYVLSQYHIGISIKIKKFTLNALNIVLNFAFYH